MSGLQDYLPDPRLPALADVRERNLFLRGDASTQLTTITVGGTATTLTSEPLRIRSAQVQTVSGGTITVQVQLDGRDIFDDTVRPVSGSVARDPTNSYIVPAGTVITTTVEADSGVPAGTANVVIETEPYILVPRTPEIKLKGKDRLRVSKRRQAEAFAQRGSLRTAAVAARREGAIGTDATRPDITRTLSPVYGQPPKGGYGDGGGGGGGGGGSNPPSPGYPGGPRRTR